MPKILLISYDNGSHIPFFPQNVFALYSYLMTRGHTVAFWNQDISHAPDSALTQILDENPFDFVGLGFVAGYYQYRKAKGLSRAINRSKRRREITYILGGHGPAAEPEWFMGKLEADAVVVGDGEYGIKRVIENNKRGVVYGEPYEEDRIHIKSYEEWSHLINIYRMIRWPTSNLTDFCFPVLSSRGCKWQCSFCYRMRKGFHERSVEAIMEEIKWLYKNANITHFQFSDELLMGSERRVTEICTAILNLQFQIKWDCNGRLNFAKPSALKLMRKSGCEYINYGIESLNQTILNQMGKGLTVEQIHQGVQETVGAGLTPGINVIWGFPGDTHQNLLEGMAFIRKYNKGPELRTIRPVTPYPGTPLYKKALADGLLDGPEDFYENKHVNSDLMTVNFTDIPTPDAHRMLYECNSLLIDDYYGRLANNTGANARKLYIEGKTDFRGFRDV